jgi:hypothetical protein
MTCRDCKLFDLEAAKDKAGRVQSKKPVPCLWLSKEQYPVSIREYISGARPRAGYVTAKDGYRCPCFQKREGR